ncbi:hypothetical protein OAS86_06740 [Gammaproteobacteria bacterium]|nr:hypothetical protein [Gammaproteobacteria bacterium]
MIGWMRKKPWPEQRKRMIMIAVGVMLFSPVLIYPADNSWAMLVPIAAFYFDGFGWLIQNWVWTAISMVVTLFVVWGFSRRNFNADLGGIHD